MKVQILADLICPKCKMVMQNIIHAEGMGYFASCRNMVCELFDTEVILPFVEVFFKCYGNVGVLCQNKNADTCSAFEDCVIHDANWRSQYE
jgi:hypothetical protein